MWCGHLWRGNYTRYLATLPQEFGMLFILPAAYFAIVFFQRYDEKIKEVRQQYLFFFMLSLSLSLAAHFYDTIVLGVFCVGIGLGFFFRLFQPKYLGKIVAAGILGIVLAVIPLVVGVAVGNKLEGSLYWAMGVMKGKDSDTSSSNTVTVTLTPQDQTREQHRNRRHASQNGKYWNRRHASRNGKYRNRRWK